MSADESRYGPHTRKLLSMLTDDWQDLEVLIQEMTITIPPGKAIRAYRAERERGIKRANSSAPDPRQLSDTEQIASGARTIIRDSVRTLAKRTAETRLDEHGTKWIKLKAKTQKPQLVHTSDEIVPVCDEEFDLAPEYDKPELSVVPDKRPALADPDVILAVSELVTMVEKLYKTVDALHKDVKGVKREQTNLTNRINMIQNARRTDRARTRGGQQIK